MIRTLIQDDREKIKNILIDTNNFSDDEVSIALELLDVALNNEDQKDYEIFVDENDDDKNELNGYVCIGPRPLTEGTYDLYWIAVNPKIQSRGVGSKLVLYIENHIKSKGGYLVLIETSGKPSYEKERKFYEKNNYRKAVELEHFYKKNDSLVIYSKYLS
ncbi:MAG: GNAT family N-acetyltransferase [Ignavibacteria bacterium]|nr:GNAT family N-acetyltransferase [Ignavibacteria bacterium]